MLKEGDTAAKRDAMRFLLKINGYQNGHVTIDASDWAIDQRLTARLKKGTRARTSSLIATSISNTSGRAHSITIDSSDKVLGRPVKHTVLMHFNLLNGLFLGDLLAMYKRKGWKLIDAEEAFTDPVFLRLNRTLFRQVRVLFGPSPRRTVRFQSRCAIRLKMRSMKTRGWISSSCEIKLLVSVVCNSRTDGPGEAAPTVVANPRNIVGRPLSINCRGGPPWPPVQTTPSQWKIRSL